MLNAIDLLTFLFGLLIIVSILGFGRWLKGNGALISNLPPGPWKLPLIRNIHPLFGNLPHRTLSKLAMKYGALMHLQIGELSLVVISSPEMAKQVLATHDMEFGSRANTIATKILIYDSKGIGFSSHGEYWRRLRRIYNTELFRPKHVHPFGSIREEQTSNLIRWIASNEGKPINLTEKVDSLIYNTIAMAAFGKKNEDQESFQKLMKQIIKILGGFDIADIYPSFNFLHSISRLKPALERLHSEIDMILQKMINDHRRDFAAAYKYEGAEESKHLVDVLLKHGDENAEFHLADENIKALLLEVLFGGSDSSSTTIDWAMSEIMKNPRIPRRAQEEVRQVFGCACYVDEKKIDDLKYMKSIIKETLRLFPPGPLLLPRLNSQRQEINGYEIPAKTRVLVNVWAFNNDPTHWQDVDCFQPERFLDSLID